MKKLTLLSSLILLVVSLTIPAAAQDSTQAANSPVSETPATTQVVEPPVVTPPEASLPDGFDGVVLPGVTGTGILVMFTIIVGGFMALVYTLLKELGKSTPENTTKEMLTWGKETIADFADKFTGIVEQKLEDERQKAARTPNVIDDALVAGANVPVSFLLKMLNDLDADDETKAALKQAIDTPPGERVSITES